MKPEGQQTGQDLPFPVAAGRFDQKNEMFKRSLWDKKMLPHAMRFYKEVKFKEKVGYRKIDYAFRNASWNLEWSTAFGNSRSNSGLYAWEGVNERIKPYVESGDPVKASPEEMSRKSKRWLDILGQTWWVFAGFIPTGFTPMNSISLRVSIIQSNSRRDAIMRLSLFLPWTMKALEWLPRPWKGV